MMPLYFVKEGRTNLISASAGRFRNVTTRSTSFDDGAVVFLLPCNSLDPPRQSPAAEGASMILFKCVLALLIILGHAMGPRVEDLRASCERLQLSSCSEEAQKPQQPSTAN